MGALGKTAYKVVRIPQADNENEIERLAEAMYNATDMGDVHPWWNATPTSKHQCLVMARAAIKHFRGDE